MEYAEEDYLLLSGIQHFQFCRRQWALIHIEQQWEENLRTVEGELFHAKAHDDNFVEKRKNIIITRGMRVFSHTLGINGVCDIVEFIRNDKDGISIFGRKGKYIVEPVEYKRGEPKIDQSDVLQVVAQAMCLEEMMACHIKKGYIFYGATRRRETVNITDELRDKVKKDFKEMHQYFEKKYTPKVKWTKSCNACSMKNICLPILGKNKSVQEYIKNKLEEN